MIATLRTIKLPRSRRGFTLVELLVAMALIIFIMVILTEAFAAGTGAFRALKSAGDMQERLRAAESLIRQDLVHNHFGGPPAVKLSTLNGQPNQGYFFIQQSGSLLEGTDAYGNTSYRMNTNAPPLMCFTVNLGAPFQVPPVLGDKGFLPSDFVVGRLPTPPPIPPPPVPAADASLTGSGPADYQQSNAFISQWAEVGYFLMSTGRTAGTASPLGPQPLYSLRRRIRPIVADPMNTGLNSTLNGLNIPASQWGHYAEVSCIYTGTVAAPGLLTFPTPTTLAGAQTAANQRPMMITLGVMPTGQPGIGPLPLGSQNVVGQIDGQLPPAPGQFSPWAGDDLVITDVISFNIRVFSPTLFPTATDYSDLSTNTVTPGYYDTASTLNTTTTPPSSYPINALEITIRIWDPKTSLARQLTIVQDM
jgi:prepilin-type N-terminal cleavage/methylation domain-containing protein